MKKQSNSKEEIQVSNWQVKTSTSSVISKNVKKNNNKMPLYAHQNNNVF